MKLKTVSVSLLLIFLCGPPVYGDCIARGYLQKDGEPRFRIKSCKQASVVIDTGTIDHRSSQPTSKDQAVLVVPVNASAKSMMRADREHWHYQGSCRDLIFEKVVRLELKVHCSDMGMGLYGLLGDVTIVSSIEPEG